MVITAKKFGIYKSTGEISWTSFASEYNAVIWQGRNPAWGGIGSKKLLRQDGIADTSFDISSVTLHFNQEYYWYVMDASKVDTDTSNWHEYYFTTEHLLVAPGNTLTGVSLLPTFEWKDAGAASYELKVGTTSGAGDVFDKTGITDTSYTLTEEDLSGYLQNGKNYYWSITYNDGTDDLTPDEYTFTTIPNINLTLSFPANGTTVYNYSSVMFSWYFYQAVGSTKFEVEVCESETAPTVADWKNSSITQTFDAGGSLNYTAENKLFGGTKYYWRVKAKNSSDEVVKVSSVYSFTTSGGATKAYPSYPTSSFKVYTLTPSFYWYSLM